MSRSNLLRKKRNKPGISSQISETKAEIRGLRNFVRELNKERKAINPNAKTQMVNIDINSLKAEKELGELKSELNYLRKKRITNFFRAFKPSKRVNAKKAEEKASY